ncbi:MAG: hypothetical protein K6F99_00130 [Lachnospiraceae bacterium]|nr:hypothetical protein [Lachnospiraceae bacterium]
MKKAEKIISYIPFIILGLISIYFVLVSVFTTCIMGPSVNEEHTYFTGDNPFIHIISLIAVSAAGYLLLTKTRLTKFFNDREKLIELIFMVLYLAIGFYFVLNTQFEPVEDQKTDMVNLFRLRAGDFSDLMPPDGDMYLYPHQLGLITFYYFLSLFFGSYNYTAFELINIVFLAFSGLLLGRIAQKISNSASVKACTYIAYIAFFPSFMFGSYIYGLIPGYCFMVAAIYFYTVDENLSNKTILLTSVFIGLAIMLKSNCYIAYIALLLVLAVEVIFKKDNRKRRLILILLMTLCAFSFNAGAKLFIGHLTGIEPSKPMPSSFYIYSGISEGKRAPGWKTNDRFILDDAGFDKDKIDEIAKNAIKERLNEMTKDPKYLLKFFGEKQASQWANPSFECFLINAERKTILIPGEFIRSLCNGPLSEQLYAPLNIMMSLLYFGLFLYFIFCFKTFKLRDLPLAITVIGGFMIHFIWEAKSKYVFVYFLMLFPYFITGYRFFFKYLRDIFENKEGSRERKMFFIRALAGIMIIAVISFSNFYYNLNGETNRLKYTVKSSLNSYTYFLDKAFKLWGDEEALEEMRRTYEQKDGWGSALRIE